MPILPRSDVLIGEAQVEMVSIVVATELCAGSRSWIRRGGEGAITLGTQGVPPYGLTGGSPGALGRSSLIVNEEKTSLAGKCTVEVRAGSVIRVETQAGRRLGQEGRCVSSARFASTHHFRPAPKDHERRRQLAELSGSSPLAER